MSKLIEFLAKRDISNITKSVRISKEIPFDFVIKALLIDKFNEIQTGCKGKISKKGIGIDTNKMQTKIVIEGTIEPDFANTEFLNSLGVITSEEAINKVLLAGEFTELYTQISELSGFDRDINEDIKEAKNS